MDVLTDLLARSRAHGAVFAHATLRGTAGIAYRPSGALGMHAVLDGSAVVSTPMATSVLGPGDLAVVRGDVTHDVASVAGAPCVPITDLVAATVHPTGAPDIVAGADGDAVTATYVCGAYQFDGELCDGLLRRLPPVLHLRPAAGSPLRAAIDLLAAEVRGHQPGQQLVLDRLLDVALVQVLREHLVDGAAPAPGWFRGSADPATAAALRAMHADPAAPWSIASLAAHVGLSRAAFARRFADAVGVPPMTYLAEWRMALARELLRGTADGLAPIADAVGYSSEFAFAAAFKRRFGVAPGRWRRTARDPAAPATISAGRP